MSPHSWDNYWLGNKKVEKNLPNQVILEYEEVCALCTRMRHKASCLCYSAPRSYLFLDTCTQRSSSDLLRNRVLVKENSN